MEIQYEYIYLIREREFIKSLEEIYKIGRTCQADFKRFDAYPKNSHLLLFIDVPDCKCIEKILIKKFKGQFKHRKDIGNEYFEGDKCKMMKEIVDIIQTFKPKAVGIEVEKEKLEKEKMEVERKRLGLEKEREKIKLEKEKLESERKKIEFEKQKIKCEKIKQSSNMVLIPKYEVKKDKSSYINDKSKTRPLKNDEIKKIK